MINQAISYIIRSSRLRFCTPGHKGKLLKSDITEIDTAFPAGLIQKAEARTAQTMGVERIRFLTGGSSIGIKAALLNAGDILTAANAHQSIAEAVALAKSQIFFIENQEKDDLKLPLTKQQIGDGLKRYPSVQTVVLMSPDYYGLNASIEAAEAVIKAGKNLYIDAAHGAHFLFRPDLFDCRLFSYAYAFNLSAHKTLPAYTQTAYLAINASDHAGQIDDALTLLGTTSPSYPMLAGLEEAAEFTDKNRTKFDCLKRACDEFRGCIPCVKNDDFTRLVVDANALNTDGKTLYFNLKGRGIIAEKYDPRYVIFIVTVCDKPKDVKSLQANILKCKFKYINIK